MDYKVVTIIIITTVISALVTFFVTSISRRKGLDELKLRQVAFEKEISETVKGINKEYQVLRVSMVFMVTQLGGNPSEMGLM